MSAIRERLEQAAAGLTYTSESDRPFEAFELPGGGAGWPYGVEEFARRIGAPAGAPAGEQSLYQLFAPHIERTDPYDTQTQALRPRYEALRALLTGSLRDVRVFRIGRIEIDVYAVGADEGGNLVGLRTVAVET